MVAGSVFSRSHQKQREAHMAWRSVPPRYVPARQRQAGMQCGKVGRGKRERQKVQAAAGVSAGCRLIEEEDAGCLRERVVRREAGRWGERGGDAQPRPKSILGTRKVLLPCAVRVPTCLPFLPSFSFLPSSPKSSMQKGPRDQNTAPP